jgi:hypothetical protein
MQEAPAGSGEPFTLTLVVETDERWTAAADWIIKAARDHGYVIRWHELERGNKLSR